MPWCAKVRYRTHVTRFGNTTGLPIPVLNARSDGARSDGVEPIESKVIESGMVSEQEVATFTNLYPDGLCAMLRPHLRVS